MPEIALEPRPGDSLGPYRITRVIGRGRMGIVFEGTEDGGEPVALKVVTTELSQDDVFLRRFRREVKAAQKIEHPNVVPVLDDGDRGRPALPGAAAHPGRLAGRRGSTRARSTLEGGAAARGCAAGIDALHAAGLVHRDIKPANILLDGDDRLRLRLRPRQGQPGHRTSRGPGQALGSLDYMSPEQIRGEDVEPGHRHLRARLRDVSSA